jgi:hypothetical protein
VIAVADSDDEIRRIQPELRRGGKWTVIGLDEYRIPPLGFEELKDFEDDIRALREMQGGLPTKAQMGIISRMVHAALARNYPKLTIEDVRPMIDVGNCQRLIATVMALSGYEKGGGDEPGETRASTGTPSTAH